MSCPCCRAILLCCSAVQFATCECRFGPTDNSKAPPVHSLLPKEQRPPHTRVGKVERGLSCKRGCLMCVTASQLALWPEITHIVGKHFDHVNASGAYCHGPEAELHIKKKHKHAYTPHRVAEAAQAVADGATAAQASATAVQASATAAPDATAAADYSTTAAPTASPAVPGASPRAATAAPATEANSANSLPVKSKGDLALALSSTIIASCNGDQKLLDVLSSYLRRAQNTIDGIKARNSLGKARSAAHQRANAPHDSIAQLAATLTERQAATCHGTARPAGHLNQCAQLGPGRAPAAPIGPGRAFVAPVACLQQASLSSSSPRPAAAPTADLADPACTAGPACPAGHAADPDCSASPAHSAAESQQTAVPKCSWVPNSSPNTHIAPAQAQRPTPDQDHNGLSNIVVRVVQKRSLKEASCTQESPGSTHKLAAAKTGLSSASPGQRARKRKASSTTS